MRVAAHERLLVVRSHTEDLHAAAVDVIAQRPDQSLVVQLPFVSLAGRKRQERRAPVPKDGDTHFVAEARRMPVVMFDVHRIILSCATSFPAVPVKSARYWRARFMVRGTTLSS